MTTDENRMLSRLLWVLSNIRARASSCWMLNVNLSTGLEKYNCSSFANESIENKSFFFNFSLSLKLIFHHFCPVSKTRRRCWCMKVTVKLMTDQLEVIKWESPPKIMIDYGFGYFDWCFGFLVALNSFFLNLVSLDRVKMEQKKKSINLKNKQNIKETLQLFS